MQKSRGERTRDLPVVRPIRASDAQVSAWTKSSPLRDRRGDTLPSQKRATVAGARAAPCRPATAASGSQSGRESRAGCRQHGSQLRSCEHASVMVLAAAAFVDERNSVPLAHLQLVRAFASAEAPAPVALRQCPRRRRLLPPRNDGERLGADGGPNGRDARRRSVATFSSGEPTAVATAGEAVRRRWLRPWWVVQRRPPETREASRTTG